MSAIYFASVGTKFARDPLKQFENKTSNKEKKTKPNQTAFKFQVLKLMVKIL